MRCRECGAETPDHPRCIVCGAPTALQRSFSADNAEAPVWSSNGAAPTVLTGDFGPGDEFGDLWPARRRGRIVPITIAVIGVLAVTVAAGAVAGSMAHRHASTSVRLTATLTGPGSFVSSGAFSPDGHTLATGDNNGSYLWYIR